MRRFSVAMRTKGATLLAAALAVLVLCLPAAAGAAEAPQRIVALTPFAANTLAKLNKVPVAIGETLGGNERFSAKLEGVDKLPLSHPNGPNLEQLAALDPDLVFSSKTWAKGNEAMEELGIEVVVRDPNSIAGALADTFKIGAIVGRRQYARSVVKSMRKKIAQAKQGIGEEPSVMLILGVGRTPFTFLPNSWGGDIVAKAGGDLLTGGVKSTSGFERISDETVFSLQPEIIIAVPHANADDIPALKEYMEDNPVWANTPAGRNGRIYVSTDNSLLQAGTDVDRTIRKVRSKYLQN